jgi:PilZ domain
MANERKPARPERRTSERQPCALETSCLRAADGQGAWDARVIDISSTGVGLLMGRRFEPGTLLSFRLEGRSEGQSYNALARVIHATRQAGGGWLLGCALLDELDASQLRAFRAAAHVLAECTAEALRRELTRDRGRTRPEENG